MKEKDRREADLPAGDESFLSRWSRRKTRARDHVEPNEAERALEPAHSAAGERTAVPDAGEAFDITKLPRVEDLTADSDFAQFLGKGVPEELKRLALRRAWSLDPGIRDFIEIAENQYDFNAPNTILGFGDLPAGSDLDKLLAQATGQLPGPEPAPREIEPVAAELAARDDMPEIETADAAAPAPNEPSDGDGEAVTEASSQEDLEPDAEPLAPVRRRHGGALPV